MCAGMPNLAALLAAVLSYSGNTGGGGRIYPPPPVRVLNTMPCTYDQGKGADACMHYRGILTSARDTIMGHYRTFAGLNLSDSFKHCIRQQGR